MRLGDANPRNAPGRDENTSGVRGHQGDPQWAEDGPEDAPDPLERCEPGTGWFYCDHAADSLSVCRCTCTCRDQAHCPKLLPKGYADDEATF